MATAAIIVLVTLILAAFFSGLETAFAHSNKLMLEIGRKQKGVSGSIADVLVRNSGQLTATILSGNKIALVIYTLGMTMLIRSLSIKLGIGTGGGAWRVALETLIAATCLIFIGTFTPKAAARNNPNGFLKTLAVPAYIFYVLLYPIAKFIVWMSDSILRALGLDTTGGNPIRNFEKADLGNLLEENPADVQTEEENEIKIFQNALDFSELLVRDCMIQRIYVVGVDVETGIKETVSKFIDSTYSRLFVWEGSIDNIIGYINLKSLFSNPSTIRECLMTPVFLPETMPAEKALRIFTDSRNSIGVVIDEFGGTAGIISLEDVLEEIFGEIDDEHDAPKIVEKTVGDNEYIFSGRLEVEYLNEKYGLGIDESEDYDTLAGYIINNESKIPASGKVMMAGNKEIRILKSSSSKIELVKIRIIT